MSTLGGWHRLGTLRHIGKRRGQLFQCSFQHCPGAGEVDPLELFAADTEHGTFVKPELGTLNDPFASFGFCQAGCRKIEPGQVGPLRLDKLDGRQSFSQELAQKVDITPQIKQQLVQPRRTKRIGRLQAISPCVLSWL